MFHVPRQFLSQVEVLFGFLIVNFLCKQLIIMSIIYLEPTSKSVSTSLLSKGNERTEPSESTGRTEPSEPTAARQVLGV